MIDISLGISIFLTTLSVNAQGGTQAEEYSRASRAVTEIYYKESGLAQEVKRYEKRYISADIRHLGGNVAVLAKIAIEQKIIFKWDF